VRSRLCRRRSRGLWRPASCKGRARRRQASREQRRDSDPPHRMRCLLRKFSDGSGSFRFIASVQTFPEVSGSTLPVQRFPDVSGCFRFNRFLTFPVRAFLTFPEVSGRFRSRRFPRSDSVARRARNPTRGSSGRSPILGVLKGTQGVLEAGPLAAAQDAAPFSGYSRGTQGVLEAGPLAAAQDAALQALTAEVAQLHSQVRTRVLKGHARGTQGVLKGYSSHVCPLRHINACT
jgi:hypothetical protein